MRIRRLGGDAIEAASGVKNDGDGVFPGELYRARLTRIGRKLAADEYGSSRDLLQRLAGRCKNSLKARGGVRVALGSQSSVSIRKVRLFGLHLVPLEVREDANLHRAALDEIFDYYDITAGFMTRCRSARSRRC